MEAYRRLPGDDTEKIASTSTCFEKPRCTPLSAVCNAYTLCNQPALVTGTAAASHSFPAWHQRPPTGTNFLLARWCRSGYYDPSCNASHDEHRRDDPQLPAPERY